MILFDNLYTAKEPEHNCETFNQLFQNNHYRIETIRSHLSSPGEFYNQDEDEWVVLIEGEAVLEIKGVKHHLQKGESCYLPKHTQHRVLSTSKDALWLGVFSS